MQVAGAPVDNGVPTKGGAAEQSDTCSGERPPTSPAAASEQGDDSCDEQRRCSIDLNGRVLEMTARTGRERQRYAEGGQRLVCGCIPVRALEDGKWEVMMVTSRRGNGLIFPKGGWETDETAEEAAARESWEEAGVRGVLTNLGHFEFLSKSQTAAGRGEGKSLAHVFVMHVAEEHNIWPERECRERSWWAPQDAIERCHHSWMQDALRKWACQQQVAV
mmetsp:Transcript_20842/g.70977  ORF Transcript_20842/g.70977 Transcript_20842/m.70977 type:complete len:219 (+) Transcript_20842:241-897(+)